MSLDRIEFFDFRIFTAATFTPETEGTTVISGPNGTGKTSVLEAMVYLGTQRSFRGAPREAMVRTGADRAIIRAELRGAASPTLVARGPEPYPGQPEDGQWAQEPGRGRTLHDLFTRGPGAGQRRATGSPRASR